MLYTPYRHLLGVYLAPLWPRVVALAILLLGGPDRPRPAQAAHRALLH